MGRLGFCRTVFFLFDHRDIQLNSGITVPYVQRPSHEVSKRTIICERDMKAATCERSDPVTDLLSLRKFLTSGAIVTDPNEPDHFWLGIGQPEMHVAPSADCLSIHSPDFFLVEPRPWFIFRDFMRISGTELLERLNSVEEPVHSLEGLEESSFGEFEHAVEGILEQIRDGSLIKAVPHIERTYRGTVNPARLFSMLVHGIRHTFGQALHLYGLWSEDGNGILGVTPEILFSSRGNSVITMALAGTRQSGQHSLLTDTKEVSEHQIVADGIVQRLRSFGSVAVGKAVELRLPYLIHLYSPIELTADRPVAFEEMVAALHPTAAIGAWPREAGAKWLRAQPNAIRRGKYGAPFGLVAPNSETSSCLVAIRGVQWTPNTVQLQAGCGIVAGSQVAREWREVNAKLDSVREALGL
jgi:isochorismate synthase EntC